MSPRAESRHLGTLGSRANGLQGPSLRRGSSGTAGSERPPSSPTTNIKFRTQRCGSVASSPFLTRCRRLLLGLGGCSHRSRLTRTPSCASRTHTAAFPLSPEVTAFTRQIEVSPRTPFRDCLRHGIRMCDIAVRRADTWVIVAVYWLSSISPSQEYHRTSRKCLICSFQNMFESTAA
jgi:hypothetical protein